MIALVPFLVLALVACTPGAVRRGEKVGSGSSTPSAPRPLVLLESSYRWIPPGTDYPFNSAVDFTYVVRNPNRDYEATSTILVIQMKDASGTVFYTEDFPIRPIRAGETVVGGSQVFPDKEPASVEFSIATIPSAWTRAGAQAVNLAVTELVLGSATGVSSGQVGFAPDHSYFTGSVINSSSTDCTMAAVDVLQRDSAGKIVARYSGFVEQLRANSRKSFRLDVPDRLPDAGHYEAYARPWLD